MSEKELETYHQNGGTYTIPVEIMNDFYEDYKELKEKLEALKELDLYESEEDYDYEENLSLNYVPFDIEKFLEGDK